MDSQTKTPHGSEAASVPLSSAAVPTVLPVCITVKCVHLG